MDESEIKFSEHVNERIVERGIDKEWIYETINTPDKKIIKSQDEVHFFKKILEFAGKCLKVVFNPIKNRVITAYFDRKMTKNNCK